MTTPGRKSSSPPLVSAKMRSIRAPRRTTRDTQLWNSGTAPEIDDHVVQHRLQDIGIEFQPIHHHAGRHRVPGKALRPAGAISRSAMSSAMPPTIFAPPDVFHPMNWTTARVATPPRNGPRSRRSVRAPERAAETAAQTPAIPPPPPLHRKAESSNRLFLFVIDQMQWRFISFPIERNINLAHTIYEQLEQIWAITDSANLRSLPAWSRQGASQRRPGNSDARRPPSAN